MTPRAFRGDLEHALADRLAGLSPGDVARLQNAIREESLARGFTYDREEGGRQVINLLPLPVVLSAADRDRLKDMACTLTAILGKVLPYARKNPALAQLLPLDPEEEALLARVHSKGHDDRPPLLFRLDADLDFSRPDWAESASFYEFNGTAVGGYYYSKVSEALVADVIAREVGLPVPARVTDGMPDLMLAVMRAQAARLGRKTLNVAYIEDRTWTTGITEGPSLAEYFQARGVRAVVVDPRELRLKDSEIWAHDLPVDIVYRNMELRDLVAIEKEEGAHLRALEQAFARNQVVSSIWGEFDHKSLWEVLETPEVTRHLTAPERAFLRRHIPWTRTVRHTFTKCPDGERVDLLEFTARQRERLVLKPNRGCGGTGVTLGCQTSAGDWDAVLAEASREPGQWVVQQYLRSACRPFPTVDPAGRYVLEDLVTAYGFVATAERFGCLGRASRGAVVNVSQGGGIFPVMTVE
jgi:hypothetical protein